MLWMMSSNINAAAVHYQEPYHVNTIALYIHVKKAVTLCSICMCVCIIRLRDINSTKVSWPYKRKNQ